MQLYCLYGLTKFEKEFIVKLKINSTGLRSEENQEEQMKRKFFCKRNIIICCIVFCIVLCIIYISDDRQQKSYDKAYMAYSSDSKGDYTGALVTRVKSLTNGISGQVLCSVNDIDEEYLFDQNTIVDLSRVSSLETKSLLMGILILKLNEYRMCTSEENQPLRHVTVMEEAHNILKRSLTGGSEGSNVQAKSVEMISSAIA